MTEDKRLFEIALWPEDELLKLERKMQIALTIIMLEHIDKYDYARSLLGKVNPRTLFAKVLLELYELMLAVLDGNRSPREVRDYYRQQKSIYS